MGMVYFGVKGKGCTQWGLLVSSVDPLSSTNYLTHSYRWGSSQTFLLTHKTDRYSMWKADPCTTPSRAISPSDTSGEMHFEFSPTPIKIVIGSLDLLEFGTCTQIPVVILLPRCLSARILVCSMKGTCLRYF
jgi:hypothetical protein